MEDYLTITSVDEQEDILPRSTFETLLLRYLRRSTGEYVQFSFPGKSTWMRENSVKLKRDNKPYLSRISSHHQFPTIPVEKYNVCEKKERFITKAKKNKSKRVNRTLLLQEIRKLKEEQKRNSTRLDQIDEIRMATMFQQQNLQYDLEGKKKFFISIYILK